MQSKKRQTVRREIRLDHWLDYWGMSERQTRFCVLEPLRHEDDTGMMLFALCFAMLCDVYETGSICQQFSGVRQCRCEYVVCGAVPTLFQRRVKHVSES